MCLVSCSKGAFFIEEVILAARKLSYTCVTGYNYLYYIITLATTCFILARGFGLVVKHSTADPGIASSIPPHSN